MCNMNKLYDSAVYQTRRHKEIKSKKKKKRHKETSTTSSRYDTIHSLK